MSPPPSPPSSPSSRFATGSLESNKLAPFNPIDSSAQTSALSFLSLTSSDVLFDLGCGDGRLLLAAARGTPGLRCVGVEYDRVYYDRAVSACEGAEGVEIIHGDVVNVDLSSATAVFVYLVPNGLKLVEEKLRGVLERGGRIVSYMFSVPGVVAKETGSAKGGCKVSLYDRSSLPGSPADQLKSSAADDEPRPDLPSPLSPSTPTLPP